MASKIQGALRERFDKVKFNGDVKAIEITFKNTGNTWRIEYFLHWRGTRYGFSGNYYKAIHNENVKYFKSIETLSKAIANGYIK